MGDFSIFVLSCKLVFVAVWRNTIKQEQQEKILQHLF